MKDQARNMISLCPVVPEGLPASLAKRIWVNWGNRGIGQGRTRNRPRAKMRTSPNVSYLTPYFGFGIDHYGPRQVEKRGLT